MSISARSSELRIGGLGACGLARRFGTPLYVYDAGRVLERFARLRRALVRPGSLICYALKANSNRTLCRVLAGAGAGAEAVSGGEILRALAAGFAPARIVFSGVGKTPAEMALGLRRGLLSFNVESAEELAALGRLARRLRRPAPFSIRLNPDVKARTHPHITTGRADSKFGVEAGEALVLALGSRGDPWLRFQGLHCHIGSQLNELEPFRRAAQAVARLLERLQAAGLRAALVDMGGGLGVSYAGEAELSPRALAAVFARAFAPWPAARLLLEPGRYLVADAGVLLTRVLLRKRTSRRRFVVVDAAMNDLGRPALYGAYHPVAPARPRRGPRRRADVVGPVCESGDFLARGRLLPPLEPGDVLAVLMAGAYGFSMSSQYNSRPRAAEVVVRGRRASLARRRETAADLVRHEA
ncbi:MAG: diaminopimelate decarboxylase [Elusimicrobia bacterium]|nr:diaminopimelate decarboxylase [Elusimicrobiota bacterium]